MRRREQRHAARSRFRVLPWLPELVVLLVVAASVLQMQYDLGHRWFGLDRTDPATDPAAIAAPAGLDLSAGSTAPAVAGALRPGAVDAAAVRRALAPVMGDTKLGAHVALQVVDLSNDKTVFRRGSGAVTPASTMKLLTSAAALSVLGPEARFTTRVVATGSKLVLVGGGDPFLASSAARAKGQYPVRADLTTLATRTATALKAKGLTTVSLAYDAGLFTGPSVNPHWPDSYVPENVVPPISALWVDEARSGNGRYADDPAREAAEKFAAALKQAGVRVTLAPRKLGSTSSQTELASVQSAPVGEIVQQTLAVSDNNAAEVLARHVGIAVDGDGSFVGGLKAVFSVLEGLGVDTTGSRAYDGSGLSRENRLTATTLIDVLALAASPDHPTLREVITGLPVAGFTGSLQRRFDRGPAEAQGRVRAKTGTLTGVHGLAGIATDLDGNLMAFVFVADKVPVADTLAAQRDLDLMAAALGACRCGA